MIRRLFTIIFIVGIFSIYNEVGAVAISPLKNHVTLAPGASNFNVEVMVKNEEGVELNYKLDTVGAIQNNNGLIVFSKNNLIAEQWIVPQVENIKILPGEEKKIIYTINIPIDAQPGTYLIGLAVEPVFDMGGDNASLVAQVASILNLQVSGVVKEDLEIKSWSMPTMVYHKNWGMELMLKNKSTTEIPVNGMITVRNWFGREVYQQEINFKRAMLPGAEILFNDDIGIGETRLFPGLQSIEVTINYGLTNQRLITIKNIWYWPIYFWVIMLLLISSIVYKIYDRRR